MPAITRSGGTRGLKEFYPAAKRHCSRSPERKIDDDAVEKKVNKSASNNGGKKENTPTKKTRLELGDKKEEEPDTPGTFLRAKRCLGLGQISYNIVGRSAELDTLSAFIRQNVGQQRTSAALYVSGMPGTGKTMCVKRVIEMLRGELDFNSVWINCMGVESVGQLVKDLYEAMGANESPKKRRSRSGTTKQRQTPSKWNFEQLKTIFASECKMTVLCLDEVDQLQKKLPSLLLKLFQLASSPRSNLVFIGIANSCDLLDRSFGEFDVKGGTKPRQLHFSAYTTDEIVAIVKNRLSDYGGLLEPKALELCARKCAAATGDVRRALETCKHALERAFSSQRNDDDEASRSACTVSEILAALQDVYTPMKASTRYVTLPLQQRLLLASILSLSISGCKQFSLSKAFESYKRVCETAHVPTVGSSEAQNLCSLLESNGLIRRMISTTKGGVGTTKYTLNVDEKSAREVINDDQLLSALIGNKI